MVRRQLDFANSFRQTSEQQYRLEADYSDDGKGGMRPYELNTTWFSALNGDPVEATELQVARFVASRTVALVLRGVPGIYLPSLVGSRNDVSAVQREGHNRAINRAEISEPELFELLGDPTSAAAQVARRHAELLLRRVSEPAFHPNAPQEVLDLDSRVLAVRRIDVGGSYSLVCLINVSSQRVPVRILHEAIDPVRSGVVDLLSTRSWPATDTMLVVELDPYDVVWLKAQSAP